MDFRSDWSRSGNDCSEQIERLNQNLSAYQEIHAKYFKAQTTVRDAQVGYWFELTGHPKLTNTREVIGISDL
jgi:predicted DNA-binding protein with PD1-like motif